MSLTYHKRLSSWWFQPIWKIFYQNWTSSPGFLGENKKSLKPPPSSSCWFKWMPSPPKVRLFRLFEIRSPTWSHCTKNLTRRHIRKGLQLRIDTTCNLLKVPPRSWCFWLVFAGAGQWWTFHKSVEIGTSGFLECQGEHSKRKHPLAIGNLNPSEIGTSGNWKSGGTFLKEGI